MSQPDGRITNLNLGIVEAEDSAAFQRLESTFSSLLHSVIQEIFSSYLMNVLICMHFCLGTLAALNFDEGRDCLMSRPDGRITNLNLGIMEAEDSAAFQRLETAQIVTALCSKQRQNRVSQTSLRDASLFSCYSGTLNFGEGGDCLMSQPDGRITNLNLGIMEAEDSAAFQRLEYFFLFLLLPSPLCRPRDLLVVFNECPHLHAFLSRNSRVIE
ncbi:hypothetical protein CEXT_701861 [Caerostris extrusa]|uniref:Uncharacterized protein n=1 Tax=Caerostris extrusa TaxID=172846 RepID=A0AAV4VM58_CAEEX|nr:hypothetical protein CEXT_701861 [Caerostris extrusa]